MNRRVICALLVTLSLAGALARAEEHYEVIVERGVPAKMRDGVVLRADIYRPKADGKFPVLLTRTPYDKRGDMDFGPLGAARGYVVVVQDVRGRFTSEGDWYPSSTNRRTATTPWSGPPRCPIPMERSGCSAGLTWAPPRCSPPSPPRPTWREFCRW